jgi:hypothetical protein
LLNHWKLLVVTVRRGGPLQGRMIRFYLDGQNIGDAICSRLEDLSNNAELLVGKRMDGRAYFRGIMDELQIYRTELVPSDINKIFNAKHYGLCKSPLYDLYVSNKKKINK